MSGRPIAIRSSPFQEKVQVRVVTPSVPTSVSAASLPVVPPA
jgi:hypothetical protein